MRTVAIVQARMGSSRLPGKVCELVAGRPMFALILARLGQSRALDEIVVATTNTTRDDVLAEMVSRLGFRCVRGSETDVLSRYVFAASVARADAVVRITADCPLVDSELVDQMIDQFAAADLDYLSNVDPPTFPHGQDVEVFSRAALDRADREAQAAYDREHVTPYLRRASGFRRCNLRSDPDLSHLRWTVDEPVDLDLVRRIFDHFSPDIFFGWRAVLELAQRDPLMFTANSGLQRGRDPNAAPAQPR